MNTKLRFAYKNIGTIFFAGEIGPAELNVINRFLKEETGDALSIDSNLEVIYNKSSNFKVTIKETSIELDEVSLIPEKHISHGIRLTPVE